MSAAKTQSLYNQLDNLFGDDDDSSSQPQHSYSPSPSPPQSHSHSHSHHLSHAHGLSLGSPGTSQITVNTTDSTDTDTNTSFESSYRLFHDEDDDDAYIATKNIYPDQRSITSSGTNDTSLCSDSELDIHHHYHHGNLNLDMNPNQKVLALEATKQRLSSSSTVQLSPQNQQQHQQHQIQHQQHQQHQYPQHQQHQHPQHQQNQQHQYHQQQPQQHQQHQQQQRHIKSLPSLPLRPLSQYPVSGSSTSINHARFQRQLQNLDDNSQNLGIMLDCMQDMVKQDTEQIELELSQTLHDLTSSIPYNTFVVSGKITSLSNQRQKRQHILNEYQRQVTRRMSQRMSLMTTKSGMSSPSVTRRSSVMTGSSPISSPMSTITNASDASDAISLKSFSLGRASRR